MANRKGKCRLVKLLIPLDACKHLCAHSTLEPFRTVRDFKKSRLSQCLSPHSCNPMQWPFPDTKKEPLWLPGLLFSQSEDTYRSRYIGRRRQGTGCRLPGSSQLMLLKLTDILHRGGPAL